jgi:hypothetical protein
VITRSKQIWAIGATVKIGFLTLRITGAEATPGDHKPDVYMLESLDGSKQYTFVPHHGLERTRCASWEV